jgi:hypothetical protein
MGRKVCCRWLVSVIGNGIKLQQLLFFRQRILKHMLALHTAVNFPDPRIIVVVIASLTPELCCAAADRARMHCPGKVLTQSEASYHARTTPPPRPVTPAVVKNSLPTMPEAIIEFNSEDFESPILVSSGDECSHARTLFLRSDRSAEGKARNLNASCQQAMCRHGLVGRIGR